MRRSLMLLSNYGLSHLSLYSCEGYYTNDILSGASTGKIVDLFPFNIDLNVPFFHSIISTYLPSDRSDLRSCLILLSPDH